MTIACKGCGACCMMGSPPMYGYLLFVDGGWAKRQERLDKCWQEVQALPEGEMRESGIDTWKSMKKDIARIEAMPAEARDAIVHFWAAKETGKADQDDPCCWLDPATKECRWHEYRPETCRDFRAGSNDCHRWRESQKKAEGEDTTYK